MAKGKDGGASVTRRKYLCQLAGEIITGTVAESYTNAHMERGKEMEAEAREMYAFLVDEPLTRVGFLSDGEKRAGCSPDALVGDTGLLEIKTKIPSLAIEAMLRHDMPPEHRAQCQGALWISGRQWVELAVYWPGLPLVRHREHRDEDYIAKIASAVATFNTELSEIVDRVRRYGQPSTLKADLSASVLMAG
jgi:hypothetical protein